MDFDLQPTLEGERLTLRPLRPDDFEALHRAASDPLIWEQHPERDRHRKEVFVRYFESAIASGGAFAVIDRVSGAILGSSRYWNLQPGREVEIGWTFLERRFWGGRYNREMKELMIRHALRFVERVVFVVGPDNMRSQQALRKIGAAFVGTARRTAADGTTRDDCIFEIRRPPSGALG